MSLKEITFNNNDLLNIEVDKFFNENIDIFYTEISIVTNIRKYITTLIKNNIFYIKSKILFNKDKCSETYFISKNENEKHFLEIKIKGYCTTTLYSRLINTTKSINSFNSFICNVIKTNLINDCKELTELFKSSYMNYNDRLMLETCIDGSFSYMLLEGIRSKLSIEFTIDLQTA